MRNFGSIHIFYQKAQSKLQIVHNFHSIHIFCQMAQSKSQIVHKHLKIRKMKQVVVSWTIEIQIESCITSYFNHPNKILTTLSTFKPL